MGGCAGLRDLELATGSSRSLAASAGTAEVVLRFSQQVGDQNRQCDQRQTDHDKLPKVGSDLLAKNLRSSAIAVDPAGDCACDHRLKQEEEHECRNRESERQDHLDNARFSNAMKK